MDGFTLIDGIAVAIVILSSILAYSRGLVREVLAIGGWIVAALAAYYFAPRLEPLMREVPFVKDFIGDNCELGIIAGFVVIFAAALIALSIFIPLFSGAVQRSPIGGVDRGLGFLFGAARGVVLIVIALVVYDRLVVGDPIEMIDNSRTAEIFAKSQQSLNESIPEEAPQWIVARYEELVATCAATDAAPAPGAPT